MRARNLPLLRHNGCSAVLRYALWFYFAAQSFLRELAQNFVIHCDVIMALNIGSTIAQSTRLNDFAKCLIRKMLLIEFILILVYYETHNYCSVYKRNIDCLNIRVMVVSIGSRGSHIPA